MTVAHLHSAYSGSKADKYTFDNVAVTDDIEEQLNDLDILEEEPGGISLWEEPLGSNIIFKVSLCHVVQNCYLNTHRTTEQFTLPL